MEQAAPSPDQPQPMVLGIATAGRPEIAARTIARLARQTRQPDRIIVSVPDAADLDQSLVGDVKVELLSGSRGLTTQRNTILDLVPDTALLVFIDDDFLLADDYLAELEALFARRADVAVATGWVIEDGIHGPGLSFEDAEAVVERTPAVTGETLKDTYSGYGCNMAFRMSAARAVDARFNERLPAYGWLEDVDFCRRLLPQGRIVESDRLRGAHMGVKRGRVPGVRLGYSQIANPIHLMGRKTMDPMAALNHMGRNLIANTVKALWSEPWIDRPGRLRGNFIAIGDLLRGRLDPTRIQDLG